MTGVWFCPQAALRRDQSLRYCALSVRFAACPRGRLFSADGQYLDVGNFFNQAITILRVGGDTLVLTGASFGLVGHLASMRATAQLQTPGWHLHEAALVAAAFGGTRMLINHAGMPSDR